MTFTIEHIKSDHPLIASFQELPQKIYQPSPGPELLDPDADYLIAVDGSEPLARLSMTTASGLHETEGLTGMVGHYEALDMDAGVALLEEAMGILEEKGVKQVIGPMNGSTWERYRLALPMEDPLPFFLSEPQNPSDYPIHFEMAGFDAVDFYESRITDRLLCQKEKAERLRSKIEKSGITIKRIDMHHYDELLEGVFALSVESFAKNRFYRPINFDRFKGLYTKIKPVIDPDFVQFAFDKDGEIIGVVFAFAPDLYSGRAKLVLRTLAVVPKAQETGLGIYLMDLVHLKAYEKGFSHVIHALMHSDDATIKLSTERYYSELLRRYALYGITNDGMTNCGTQNPSCYYCRPLNLENAVQNVL